MVTLDEALSGEGPTYIKFDIEGSELDALDGGRETITRYRPKLAVCVYHLPDHLCAFPFSPARTAAPRPPDATRICSRWL